MRLPDYIVIGAPKTGTSSLCNSLQRHPNVFMHPEKELNFFNREYDRGIEWYTSQFDKAPPDQLMGEGTPAYTQGVNASIWAERMAKHLPEAKLVYLTRDPLRRIESHFIQDIANGIEDESFSAYVINRGRCETSKYHARLSEYLAHYPREQIYVGFLEELIAEPDAELGRILSFLGVDPAVERDAEEETLHRVGGRETKGRQVALHKFLRRQPWYGSVNQMLPRSLVEKIKPLLRRPIDKEALKPQWTEEALAFAIDELKDDVAAFLEFTGRPTTIWPHFHQRLIAFEKNKEEVRP